MFNYFNSLLMRSAIRLYSSRAFSAEAAAKWDIIASVCVERLPLITPNLDDMQRKYRTHISKLEVENSYKSEHEVRHEKDLIHAEMLKKESANLDLDTVSKITAHDFEDSCEEELNKFKFPSVKTEADLKNDHQSLDRNLQSHLVLLVQQKIGDQSMFVLPQGKYNDGETLKQTAERVLKESCGGELEAQIIGNAPCGYYKYNYPKPVQGAKGAKVFFYYARHLSGQVQQEAKYKWLTRNELETTLNPNYHSTISDFLVAEENA